MTLLRLARRVLLAAVLALAVLPAATTSTAQARAADARHCTPPTHVGDGRGIALALDWPSGPVPPGTPQALGIHITNFAATPTASPTLVVVHGFVPNTYTADPGLTATNFTTGVSFTLPAGIPPATTVSHTVTVKLGASVPPHATEHCDVTAISGKDQATARYDVVTGSPVVHLFAVVLPARGRPGQTVALDAVLGNAGPSNEYTGPAVFTFRAPTSTRWASPSAYRCAPDAKGTVLTCSYPGSPLNWRNELERLPLTISPTAKPRTSLTGGTVTAKDPFDPTTFHGAPFGIAVTG